MATKLKNLKVTKVDFVDEGANPDAHIRLFKRREEPLQEGGGGKGSGILKKLVAFVAKAAGMDQEEIDSAMEEIQKGDAVSFSEKITEAAYRKIADEIWDTCMALQSSLCSILYDEDLDGAGAAAAMQESLDEFHAVVQGAVAEWSGGREASIIRKDAEVSGTDLMVMKAAAERLGRSIEKASQDIEKKGRSKKDTPDNNEEQKGDKMEIDKSKLTDAERAFLESIEKRYGTEDKAEGTAPPLVSAPAAPPVLPAEDSTVAKAGGAAQPASPGQFPAVPASGEQITTASGAAGGTDDIYKGLHPAVKAELEGLKKFREEAEERELAEIAKRYAIIGKKEEELVPLFKSLKAAGGTAYNDMIAVLDQAVDTVEKSGAFSEIGKSGHGGSAGDSAWAEAEAKATELMKSKSGLSKAQALDEILMADPVLAERCEKEG